MSRDNPSRAAFVAAAGLDPDTLDRFDRYVALLLRWQSAINLVSSSTLATIWERHLLDSLQLRAFLPANARTLVDIGSGAGFPGLVLAIARPDLTVHLIESDRRKAEFLRRACIETETAATVHPARAETVAATGLKADVVTARALAPLDQLLELSEPFCHPGTVRLFPKGKSAPSELTALAPSEKIHVTTERSLTAASSAIIRIEGTRLG